MKKIILTSLIILSFTAVSNAQQDPQYTQYMYNLSLINPAYTGSKDGLSLGALYRKQWVNIEGAPNTLTFFAHSPVKKNVGLGLSVVNDRLGPVEETNVYGDFSYTLNLNEDQKLAFGIKTGATFHKIDFSIIYPTLMDPDDVFSQSNPNITSMNFGFGLFYYSQNFYLSLSIPNVLERKHLSYNTTYYGTEVAHYFVSSGYVFEINDNLKFKPFALLKSSFSAPLSLDLSANLLINEKLELGTSYRLKDSFGLMANFAVSENIRIGYAYDHIISNLDVVTPASHEIILLFDLKNPKKVQQSSRFF
jgi:type IX secretion system PorP/SprF family membrane protein